MTDHDWTTTSRHATSEGTVVYDSCHCGVARVRLISGGVDDSVLAEAASSSQRFRTLRGAHQVCEDRDQRLLKS